MHVGGIRTADGSRSTVATDFCMERQGCLTYIIIWPVQQWVGLLVNRGRPSGPFNNRATVMTGSFTNLTNTNIHVIRNYEEMEADIITQPKQAEA